MSVAGQQSPPGRAVLAPRDSGTSEVYFPWELDDAYYLRRVLAHAGAALLVLRDSRGQETGAARYSFAAALGHAARHEAHYAAALGMPEEALRETAHELLATCCELVEILLHEQLPDVFLERTFTNATALAAKCGTPHAKDNLRNLRRQWEEREWEEGFTCSVLLVEPEGSAEPRRQRVAMDLPRVHGVPPSSLAWEGTAVSAEEEEDVQEAQLVDEVKRARALEHVQTLMRTHTGLEAVQTAACNAIVDVALAAKVCQEGVGQLGVLEDAKRQMRRHADNAPVQKAACRATYSIALRNAANLQGAGKIGVMVDIQEAFRQHCDSHAVADIQKGRLGLPVDIQKAMHRLPHDSAVQQRALPLSPERWGPLPAWRPQGGWGC
eukprot:jgi/Tetstr1/425090/TSEL_015554.t1